MHSPSSSQPCLYVRHAISYADSIASRRSVDFTVVVAAASLVIPASSTLIKLGISCASEIDAASPPWPSKTPVSRAALLPSCTSCKMNRSSCVFLLPLSWNAPCPSTFARCGSVLSYECDRPTDLRLKCKVTVLADLGCDWSISTTVSNPSALNGNSPTPFNLSPTPNMPISSAWPPATVPLTYTSPGIAVAVASFHNLASSSLSSSSYSPSGSTSDKSIPSDSDRLKVAM
mmetsp:Transcript_41965/g.88115  ORF Transcript_41965/g.88115 Transcript_41965/m.88115 type:complete len:231 (-) Transcript_41965:1412-2104(-)